MRFPKRLAAVAAGMITLLTVSVAFAAWTADGSGSGEAKAVSAKGVIVAAGTASGQLYPGATGDVVFTVTNPNPYPVTVMQVKAPGLASAITSSVTDCTTNGTGLTYKWSSAITLPSAVVLAANSEPRTFTVTGGVLMGNGSHSTCSGATFTIPVAVAAESAPGQSATPGTSTSVAIPS